MDTIASTRKKNLEGQLGMFAMFEEEDSSVRLPMPKLRELPKAELLAYEKETTGIYISGHPMDDYRQYLRNTHVVHIARLMDEDSRYEDDQIVSVAGIVQQVKMKTTRNNSVMAYLTVEDDTAAMEMIAFSRILDQFGGYLKENAPVVVVGRLSLRDDKEPQIVVNRIRPMSDFEQEDMQKELREENAPPIPENATLYLRLPAEEGKLFPKVKAILNMFPGPSPVVLYFADTRHRRGTRAALMMPMLEELRNVLGNENVVVK